MKIALTGFSNSGKTAIFNALTGQSLETAPYPTTGGEPHLGAVHVPDKRVDKLSEFYKPKKTTYAMVDYVDYLGLTKGDPKQNAKVFDMIKDADAILQVVRAFEDPSVPHPLGNVDPIRDLQALELELIFGDLELVEKRLQRMEEGAKKGKKPSESEKAVLIKCREALEAETPLRAIEFDEEEQKAIRHLEFISIKPEVVVFNVSEEALKDKALIENYTGRAKELLKGNTGAVALSGKIEMELAQLAPEEAAAFLEELGIEEPALERLIKVSYRLLDYISFLTAGEDEVRAWTIKNGTTAQRAAGKIHTDIEKGFIRAEVISYNDFIKVGGSMARARKEGLIRLEGKTYIVQDGDIINFRFNV